MQKTIVRYSITFFFLLVYLNRGIFIAPNEIENNGNEELNSVIEWITQIVTGESNDIDEDGDMQSDCNSVNTITYVFYQEFSNNLDLLNSYSTNLEKISFPNEENIPQKDFYTQIDHPPETVNG